MQKYFAARAEEAFSVRENAGRFLIAAGRTMEHAGAQRFAPYGLSISDVNPLLRLVQLGAMTPRDLLDSSVLLTSAPVVSHSLNRLQDAGFITRAPHHSDGRSVLVEATGEGRAIVLVLHREIRELCEDFYTPLSEGEVGELRDLLLRLVDGLPGLGSIEKYRNPGHDEQMTVADDAGRFMIAAGRGLERQGASRFRRLGLTVSDTAPLAIVARSGPATPSKLLQMSQLLTSAPVVSHSVKRLETAGLMVRRPDPKDGRKVLCEVTVKGRTAANELLQVLDELTEAFFAPIDLEEVARLRDLLARCLDPARS
jgi:DNA-binding MarR family transcriptional regulator